MSLLILVMNASTRRFNSSWLIDLSRRCLYWYSFLNVTLSLKVSDFLSSRRAQAATSSSSSSSPRSRSLSWSASKLTLARRGGTSHVSLFLSCFVIGFPCASMIAFHVASKLSSSSSSSMMLSWTWTWSWSCSWDLWMEMDKKASSLLSFSFSTFTPWLSSCSSSCSEFMRSRQNMVWSSSCWVVVGLSLGLGSGSEEGWCWKVEVAAMVRMMKLRRI